MIKLPNKKYKIIYADPAWTFKTWSKKGNGRSPKYDLMTIEDIKKMPVNNIADKNCILFIWVTYPLLKQGLDTIEAWNFKYKTCGFSWIKKNKKSDSLFWGLGYYTRSNNEICLLATKGSPKRISTRVHQVVLDKVREHSRKPDCVREKIVQLCGDLPRIELFARQKVDGWDCWGNEV
tara:strand:+ start:4050 stop:4583 length:534 start_codon:yes stop_codon:yes gene_type:complete